MNMANTKENNSDKPSFDNNSFFQQENLLDLKAEPYIFEYSQHFYNPRKRTWTQLSFGNNGTDDIVEFEEGQPPSKRLCQRPTVPHNSPEIDLFVDENDDLYQECQSIDDDHVYYEKIQPSTLKAHSTISKELKKGFAKACAALRTGRNSPTNYLPAEFAYDSDEDEFDSWSLIDGDEISEPREGATPPHPIACDCHVCFQREKQEFEKVLEDVQRTFQSPQPRAADAAGRLSAPLQLELV